MTIVEAANLIRVLFRRVDILETQVASLQLSAPRGIDRLRDESEDARRWGCSHEPPCSTPEGCGAKSAKSAWRECTCLSAPGALCPACHLGQR